MQCAHSMMQQGVGVRAFQLASPPSLLAAHGSHPGAPRQDPFAGLDLNSPEFMTRKIEILENELAAANARVTELEADIAPVAELQARGVLSKDSVQARRRPRAAHRRPGPAHRRPGPANL